MDSKNTVYFCVVQFLQKPHPNIDQYAIVPDSWIMPRGDRVCVLYPDKGEFMQLDTFYTMDPNEKQNNIKWTQYLSEIKHTAKNYEDAKTYIQKVCREPNKRSSKIEPTLPIINNPERTHDIQVPCSSKSNVKKQKDIKPVQEKIGGDLCEEFLSALLLHSLSSHKHQEKFLHTNDHEDGSDDDDDDDLNATEPTNKCTSSSSSSSSIDDSTAERYEEIKPTKRRFTPFVLPPEYDEKDSRWTLRHRELGPGLKKLVPEYEVYIDEMKFGIILNGSTSTIELAKLLFIQIFSDAALATCSLTCEKVYGQSAEIRPGLDANGIDALLRFVNDWATRKQWDPKDENSIKSALRTELRTRRSRKNK